MTTPFDYACHALDANMILGAATSTIEKTGTFTAQEVWRSWINPGFNQAIIFMEGNLYVGFNVSVAQTVTIKWQIRSQGQTAWKDLHTGMDVACNPGGTGRFTFLLEAAALAPSGNLPFELRLLLTNPTAATITITLYASGNTALSLRAVG